MADISQNKISIPAMGERHQSIVGRMMNVFESTGDFYIKFDNGDEFGPFSSFDAEDSEFESATFINKSNEDIELKYYFGDGKINTNTISFSGSLDVKNDDINNTKNNLDDLKLLFQDSGEFYTKLRAAYKTFGNESKGYNNVASGVYTVIDPVDNVNGIILKLCKLFCASGNSQCQIYISDSAPAGLNDVNKNCVAMEYGFSAQSVLENYYMEPNKGLYAVFQSNGFGNVNYEVIP